MDDGLYASLSTDFTPGNKHLRCSTTWVAGEFVRVKTSGNLQNVHL